MAIADNAPETGGESSGLMLREDLESSLKSGDTNFVPDKMLAFVGDKTTGRLQMDFMGVTRGKDYLGLDYQFHDPSSQFNNFSATIAVPGRVEDYVFESPHRIQVNRQSYSQKDVREIWLKAEKQNGRSY